MKQELYRFIHQYTTTSFGGYIQRCFVLRGTVTKKIETFAGYINDGKDIAPQTLLRVVKIDDDIFEMKRITPLEMLMYRRDNNE